MSKYPLASVMLAVDLTVWLINSFSKLIRRMIALVVVLLILSAVGLLYLAKTTEDVFISSMSLNLGTEIIGALLLAFLFDVVIHRLAKLAEEIERPRMIRAVLPTNDTTQPPTSSV